MALNTHWGNAPGLMQCQTASAESALTRSRPNCGPLLLRVSVCPMTAQEKTFGSRTLDLLRQGPFRRYIIGSAISDTGTWMQVMAQGWVMSTLTNRALYLGLASAAAGLPTILLAMKGGEAADRYDKRKILIATQFAQTALALIL